MMRDTTIEIYNEELKFSVAHFTIFSATERERLHGHNYRIHAYVDAKVQDHGLTFDYAICRNKLFDYCQQLDRYLLLPKHSPYLTITEDQDYYYAQFNHQTMPFLKKDVRLLPIKNITLEELSYWFVEQFMQDQAFLGQYHITRFRCKVSNGPGQWASHVF